MASGPTLNDELTRLGYTTQPGRFGGKNILRAGKVVAENLRAWECWDWLRERGEVE